MKQVSLSKTNTQRQNYQGTKVKQMYIDGNTVRKIEVEERPVRKRPAKQQIGKNRRRDARRATAISFGYLFAMLAFITVGCVILISYVNLQSDITNRIEHISRMESELNSLRQENDETYTKIMSEVDLEEIKRIAIGELGMKYAKDGQVITYTGEGSDYVRQYSDIPD